VEITGPLRDKGQTKCFEPALRELGAGLAAIPGGTGSPISTTPGELKHKVHMIPSRYGVFAAALAGAFLMAAVILAAPL
jgi:hypothetical protein